LQQARPHAGRVMVQSTGKENTMLAKWTDEMIREYFDTHWNATIHEICALSGRPKGDVKRALMQGKSA